MPETGRLGSDGTDEQSQPATGPETTATPATPPESAGSPPAGDAPGRDATPSDSAGQRDDWRAQLTPEQRRQLIAEATDDDLLANDRINGRIGKLAQRQAQEARQREADARAAQRRREALQRRDPNAALEVLSEQEQRDNETLAAHEASEARSHWDEAVDYFTSAAPKAVKEKLQNKEYGQDPLRAAVGFWKDLARETVAHAAEREKELEAAIEKRLTPKIEKRLRAELLGEEPTPDLGGGRAEGGGGFGWRTIAEANAAIARMPAADYARNEQQIDVAVARLLSARRS